MMIGFCCQTPLHVLRTIQLRLTVSEFKGERAGIVILDTFSQYQEIAENLKKCGIFDIVDIIKKDDLHHGKCFYLKNRYFNPSFIKLLKKNNYTRWVAFNIDNIITEVVCNYFKCNKAFQYTYIEDAVAQMNVNMSISFVCKYIYPLTGYQSSKLNVADWWFSTKENKGLPPNIISKILPPMERTNTAFVECANMVFDYHEDKDMLEAELLIMEESYNNDSIIKDEDLQIYEEIRRRYANKKIVVKLHPRTKNNRFINFKVLNQSNIPWEVYELNRKMEDKVFLGIVCSTLISPKILFGDNNKIVMILPLFDKQIHAQNKSRWRKVYSEEDVQKYVKRVRQVLTGDSLIVTNNQDELFNGLDVMLNG